MSNNNKISREEVSYIAELARIELTEVEKKNFSEELSSVIGYIGKLKEVNTENVEPISQVTGLTNVLRDDITKNCDDDTRKKIISNFPEEMDGYIKVEKVM